ncbi:MAG: DsrE family protein [Nitrospirae bacterium]|nr:DsrE family protein [Nitrospirota bacterium]
MKLGILVNTDKHAGDVVGITKAALAKGHEVIIFMMDSGNYLLGNPDVTGLCEQAGVSMSFCDHSAQKLGVSKDGIPKKVSCGSQFDNANMNSAADRVIVL